MNAVVGSDCCQAGEVDRIIQPHGIGGRDQVEEFVTA
jgi:hypothetical protein